MISNEEVLGMIEWEGGLYELLDHGIDVRQVEDHEVANALYASIRAKSDFDFVAERLNNLLWRKGIEFDGV